MAFTILTPQVVVPNTNAAVTLRGSGRRWGHVP